MLLTFWLFTRIPIVSKLPEYTSSTKFTATEGYSGKDPGSYGHFRLFALKQLFSIVLNYFDGFSEIKSKPGVHPANGRWCREDGSFSQYHRTHLFQLPQ